LTPCIDFLSPRTTPSRFRARSFRGAFCIIRWRSSSANTFFVNKRGDSGPGRMHHTSKRSRASHPKTTRANNETCGRSENCTDLVKPHKHHGQNHTRQDKSTEASTERVQTIKMDADQDKPHGDAFTRQSAQRHAAPTTSIWGLIISKGDQDRR